MNIINKDFGELLKELRKSKRLTMRELAGRSDTSHSYLSQLENAKANPPKPNMIMKLAIGLSFNDQIEEKRIYEELMKKAGYIPDITGAGIIHPDNELEFFKDHTKVDEIMIDKLQSENEELKSKITLDKLITHGGTDLKIELDQQPLTENELHAIRLLLLGIRSNRNK